MKQLNKIIGDITPESEFCQKIDRILSGDVARTVRNHKNIGIAGARGKQIYINFDNIKDETKQEPEKEILLLKGINFHENSHIDFTIVDPDIFSKYAYGTNRPQAFEGLSYSQIEKARICFNILEDARIENLQIAKYPVLRRYFTFCVQQLILNRNTINVAQMKGEPETDFKERVRKGAQNCFLLTYGRKFIDRKLVKEYEKLSKLKNAKKIKQVFNEYNVTTDRNGQLVLSVLLMKLLEEENTEIKEPKGQHPYSPQGNSTKQKNHKEAEKKLKQNLEEADKEEKEIEKEERKQGSSEKTIEDEVKEIKKQIRDATDEILEELSEELTEDIKTVNALRKGEGYTNKDGFESNTEGTALQPNSEDLINSVKLKQLLRKLRNGLQASYIREQKSGKIDIRRAITGQGRTTKIFKKFLPNRLGRSKLGVAILLDSSGSMASDDFEKLMRMAWSIDKALNECGDKDIVLEYSVDFKVLKTLYGRKGDWKRHFDDGTNPTGALRIAYSQLLNLRRTDNVRTNIVLLFSDGYFNNGDEIVQQMNHAGMHTIFIAPSKELLAQHGSHNCKEAVAIDNTGDFERALERVIVRVHRDIHKQRCTA